MLFPMRFEAWLVMRHVAVPIATVTAFAKRQLVRRNYLASVYVRPKLERTPA